MSNTDKNTWAGNTWSRRPYSKRTEQEQQEVSVKWALRKLAREAGETEADEETSCAYCGGELRIQGDDGYRCTDCSTLQ